MWQDDRIGQSPETGSTPLHDSEENVVPTVAPTPNHAPSDTAGPPAFSAAPAERGPRYQVRSLLWGNRKRFEVRDTATGTTVAIRTTSQVADSDLMRLNMAPATDHGSRVAARPVPDAPAAPPRGRQCGRCRRVFPADPAGEATALEDWYLCEPCHDKLFAAHPAGSK